MNRPARILLWPCAALALLATLATPALAQQPAEQEAAPTVRPPAAANNEAILPHTPTEAERFDAEERAEIARQKQPSLFDALAWRVGVGLYGLRNSKQERPMIYLDVGARYKAERLYVDVHAPGLFAGFDYAQRTFRKEIIGSPEPFMLFEKLNDPAQYIHAEVASARVGQTWHVVVGADREDSHGGTALDLSAGIAGVADWVVFEARLLSEPLPEDASLGDLIVTDPIVLGLGLFGSVGKKYENLAFDLSFTIARDMFQWEAYSRVNGFIFSPDAEVILSPFEHFGIYLRFRGSLYTHVKNPRAISIDQNTGVIVNF